MKEANEMTQIKEQTAITCSILMTDSARKGIQKDFADEFAFFASEKRFTVWIEKRPKNTQGSDGYLFFFDTKQNTNLAGKIDSRVAVMECIFKNNSFLATGFHIRGKREIVETNRRLPVRFNFQVGKSTGTPLPIEFSMQLRDLPVAKERSEYVQKRIDSWEGYLRILEKNADVEDIASSIDTLTVKEDYSRVFFICRQMEPKAWKSLTGFSVKWKGTDRDIGQVSAVNRKKHLIEIDLNTYGKEQVKKQAWPDAENRIAVFSNIAQSSQVKRLRSGFKRLEQGLAQNANLDRILFDERPLVKIQNKLKPVDFQNNLNSFQQEAVQGAVNAHDLYVIQGPPGTGKTTVIAEICYQNVKAGLRTLIASQANLAVDNALGRLFDDPDARILRYGRTESIEEEGKRFLEENVALYWKDQIIAEMQKQLEQVGNKEQQLRSQINEANESKERLEIEKEGLLEKKRQQDEAGLTLSRTQITMMDIQKQLQTIEKKLKQNELHREETQRSIDQAKTARDELVRSLKQFEKVKMDDPLQSIKDQNSQLRQQISYLQEKQQKDELTKQLNLQQQAAAQTKSEYEKVRSLAIAIRPIAKLHDFQDEWERSGLPMPATVDEKIMKLLHTIDIIRTYEFPSEQWTRNIERLQQAIELLSSTLTKHQYNNRPAAPEGYRRKLFSSEVDTFLNKVSRYLVEPAVKDALRTTSFSVAQYDVLEQLAKDVRTLLEIKNYTDAMQKSMDTSKIMFQSIKQEANRALENIVAQKNERYKIEQDKLVSIESQMASFPSERIQPVSHLADKPVETLQKELHINENLLESSDEQLKKRKQLEQDIGQAEKDMQQMEEKIVMQNEVREDLIEQQENLKTALQEQQSAKLELEKLMDEPIKEAIRQNTNEIRQFTEHIHELEETISKLPATKELQETWLSMLRDADDEDLEEIRKLYVEHANVIGTTCVASGRRDFMEDYPAFDVVIIDEVSKATPPELLLPMLKGKKVILVGDHHQLPPLLGQETLDEFLDEMSDEQEKREFKKMLQESLFERLYRTLPKNNKTMLGLQYRMHEDIMGTITPFYKEDGQALACGLPDSDTSRDHFLTSKWANRSDHLLWIDTPNEPACFEDKPKDGTSRYNESELQILRDVLLELDASTAAAKQDGLIDAEAQKSVGIISFYGEQVKRVDHMLQHDLQLGQLYCRTGSVDKFQGMEMDIILLSFVRNNGDLNGDIGFAKDYRRLNVALSRAKELLVIVGSSEMFTKRTSHKPSQEMYGRLFDYVQQKQGIRQWEGRSK